MEDGGSRDYLTLYRQFFENFASTVDLCDQLPVKVASYNISESEIAGEIIDWCLQYLNQRNCPHSLIVPLCRKVLEEIIQACKKHPDFCGYRTEEDDFHTLRLMHAATRKLVEVCIRYTDNALLCTLPPPPPPGNLTAPPVSAFAIKNARRTMEDRHVAIQDLHALFDIKDCGSASYYGVFDGHNGTDAAVYCVSHLHQYLAESSHYPANPELALRDAFRKTDDRFNNKSDKENLRSGTTAVCALLRPKESMLYVAWIGDSQAVLVNQGKPYQLVKPHKPDQPEERERIEEMGGTVIYWGTWRVNGLLAVSRAIGDIEYKPYVSGEPDVRVIPLTGQEDFLVLACDGLWDFMSEQEVTDTIYEYLTKYPEDIEGVSKHLVQVGKAQGSTDNISVLVVFLKERGSKTESGTSVSQSQSQSVSVSTSTSTSSSSSGISSSGSGSGGGGGGAGGMDVYLKQNGRGGGGGCPAPVPLDEDDFGPETDVDSVDDVLLSPSIAAAKALAAHSPGPGLGGEVWVPRGKLQRQQESWLKTLPWSYADALRKPPPQKTATVQQQQPPPPVEELNNDVVGEGEAESGEDSEEEWNYIRGEQKEIEKKKEEEQEDESDMESRLNPNAAEFVPGMALDKTLEDVVVPPLKEFCSDIAERPSEIDPLCEKVNTSVQDVSLNGGDETEILSTKAEFGDESAYSMSMSMNTSVAFLIDEETKEIPERQDTFENEFIKDHFASPVVELTKQETTGQLPDKDSTTDSFIIQPDFKRDLELETNMAETSVWLSNRPISPPNDLDSPYDFMSNTDKSDGLSPVDLPDRHPLGANQEPTSSSGFDSESNEEIDSNIQEKLIDTVSFDVDEAIKYKEMEDDNLLRETTDDTLLKESELLMPESATDTCSQENDYLTRVEEQIEEERPVVTATETELVCIETVERMEEHTPETCLELHIPEDSPKKVDEDEESTQPLESPCNETLGSSREQIEDTTASPLLAEEEPEHHVTEVTTVETNILEKDSETQQTVDFIQDLQFNGGMKEEEEGQHSNENTMESEIEAGFEIISHETADELQEESKSVTEMSSTDEKLIIVQNEIKLSSPQNEIMDEAIEDNHLANADMLKADDFTMDEVENVPPQTNDYIDNILSVDNHEPISDLIESEIKANIFETEVLHQDLITKVTVEESRTKLEETKEVIMETVNEPENLSVNECGLTVEEAVSVDNIIEVVKEDTKEEIITTVIEEQVPEFMEKPVAVEDLSHLEEKIEVKPQVEEVTMYETENVNFKEENLINVIEKSEVFPDLSGFAAKILEEKKQEEVNCFNETIVKEEFKIEETEGFENINVDVHVQFSDNDTSKTTFEDLPVMGDRIEPVTDKILESILACEDKLNEITPVLNENVEIPQNIEGAIMSEPIEQTPIEDLVMTDKEIKVSDVGQKLITEEVTSEIVALTEVEATSIGEVEVKKPDEKGEDDSTKPNPLEIEVGKLAPLENSVTTPPSTPAPGIKDDNSQGLIAAAVAAAATVAGAATVAAITTPSTKEVEKPAEVIKQSVTSSPKKPAVQAKAATKPGVAAKSPTKPGAPTPGAVTKKAAGSPAAKPSPSAGKTNTTAPTKTATKPASSTTKPATPSSKSPGGKPPTPTTKLGASPATKTAPSSSPTKPITKPAASTVKPPVKSTTAKPTTPTGVPKPKPSDVTSSKPKVGTTTATTKPPTEKAPVKDAIKKPAVSATTKPPVASKMTTGPAATKAASSTSKPATAKAPVPAAGDKPKTGPVKPPTSSTAAPKPKAPSRPTSAKPLASAPKAPAPKTATSKPAAAVPKVAAMKAAGSVPTKSAAAAPAKPKAPSAAPKAKPATGTKKPVPTDKSVKEATNNKLSTVKSQGKKEVIEDKERRVLGDEPATQEHLVTTTNGHVDIIENGIGNGRDSPIEKSHPEIEVSLN